MTKAVKKLRKLKDKLDVLETKEHEILDPIDAAIEELEEDSYSEDD